MKKSFQYVSHQSVSNIREYFRDFRTSLIDDAENAREMFLKLLGSNFVRTEIGILAKHVAHTLHIPMEKVVLQRQPTPRIYRPGQHGTSPHCDYWYGHGIESYTVWICLTDYVPGSSFWMVRPELNDSLLDLMQSDFSQTQNLRLFEHSCFEVKAEDKSCAVFSSLAIHGSPRNTSDQTRLSFDFRIGRCDDSSTTKDPYNFGPIDIQINAKIPDDNFKNGRVTRRKFLKYICGGRKSSTLSQHVIIEGVAKHLGIEIVAQEAEVERLGQPVLDQYANGLLRQKGFDGIIVSDRAVLSDESYFRLLANKVLVIFALEFCTNLETRELVLSEEG